MPLRAWLALAVMIAIVGGVGYLLYDRLFGVGVDADLSRELRDVVPGRGPGAFAARIGQGPAAQPDGVRQTSNTNFQIKAGEARVVARRPRADADWVLTFSYIRRDLVTPEQDAALTARWRLPRDPAYVKSLNVSPEQLKQLEAVPGREGMIVTDADRQRFKALFDAYVNAPPPRERQTGPLVEALREIGDKSLDPTRRALADRAAQIQQILTREQLEKFRRAGN